MAKHFPENERLNTYIKLTDGTATIGFHMIDFIVTVYYLSLIGVILSKFSDAINKFNGSLVDLEKVFESLLQRMKKNASELSLDERRKLVRLLVEEVVIEKKNVKVVHSISPLALAKKVHENCQLKTDSVSKPGVTEGNPR